LFIWWVSYLAALGLMYLNISAFRKLTEFDDDLGLKFARVALGLNAVVVVYLSLQISGTYDIWVQTQGTDYKAFLAEHPILSPGYWLSMASVIACVYLFYKALNASPGDPMTKF
jgi:hypothetical protein